MTETGPSGSVTRAGRVEGVLLDALIIVGLVAWGIGLRTRAYDYDEVMHAHAVWLDSRGDRPYTGFFEVHPPYFPIVAPLMRWAADPCVGLQALRTVGAAGSLVFLAGLGVLAATALPGGDRSGRPWAWLGVGVVAFHPAVLEYLVEFRVDGWGYALATWALVRFRREGRGIYRSWEFGTSTAVATLICPKLALLPPLVVLADLVTSRRAWRETLRLGVGYGLGLATAAGLILIYLWWNAIDVDATYQLVFRYNAISNANSAFRNGLAYRLAEHRDLSGLVLLGVIGWAVDLARRRALPGPVEVGLVGWLVLQAGLVTYPHKQYYAPWYLFASPLLAFAGRGLMGLPGALRLGVFGAAVAFTAYGDSRQAAAWYRIDDVRGQDRLIRWMDQVAGPDDRVVASPPSHPVDRRDTFFLWLNTSDPRGFDAQQILGRIPAYRWAVAPSRFREELEAHPPALVLISSIWGIVPYTEGQNAALAEFLRRHRYQVVDQGSAVFALRPDRHAFALGQNLLR